MKPVRICFANPHRLQWHTEIRGSAGAKRAESTIPETFLAPWSGQRDVRASASRTRTGCGDLLGFTETIGKTLLNWPSRGLPRSVERATGRPRICFANPHRLQAPVGAFACSLQTLRVCLTLAPCRVRVPALY